MKTLNRRVKGFTLTEMIVVIAIIGVLLGILAPTMSAYYWKSRVKSANADAKMIYNAAQTEVQKYISFDRMNPSDSSGLNGTMLISYSNQSGGNFRYVLTEDGHALASSTPIAISGAHASSDEEAAASVADAVNKTVSGADTKCWAVYINNYIVKASIAADNNSTFYVGHYSTGKIIVPDSRPNVSYASWLTGNGADNSLIGIASKYDTIS
ncbi:MAG: type II secretion system protein [Ruminococcus sp.]|nr:type II secretion system protein [Ruminococcus sp.]